MEGEVPCREPHLAWVDDQDDRVAVVRLGRPAAPPVVLTGTGAAIFRLIDGRRTTSEIVALVAAAYDTVDGAVSDHVTDFLAELHDEGILA